MTESTDSQRSITRSATSFFSGTLISRATGLARDMVMAATFGSHPSIAAFMVAFRFSQLLRRLFGEGAMQSALIPQFEAIRSRDTREAGLFFRDINVGVATVLLLIIIVSEGALYGWLFFGDPSPGNREIILLTMLMLPGLLFICLYGLNLSFLQCEKKYFLPSAAPLVFNVIWIVAVLALRGVFSAEAMFWLSGAIVLATFAQWAVTLPQTLSILKGFIADRLWGSFEWFWLNIRRIIKPLFLGMIGVTAVQINAALDGIFARAADAEGPAFLWYAIRVQQAPLALFGIALSGALLPPLSRAIKSGDLPQFRAFLGFAVRKSSSLMIPCTFAMIVLGISGVNLLYGRGAFTVNATVQTTLCIWAYGIGTVPGTLVLLLAPACYARGNYRLPALSSAIAVLVNVLANIILVFGLSLGAVSIALATSFAALCNCWILLRVLNKELGPLIPMSVWTAQVKPLICSVVASIATLALGYFALYDNTAPLLLGMGPLFTFPRAFMEQFVTFCALLTCFTGTLVGMAWLLNAEDLLALLKRHKR